MRLTLALTLALVVLTPLAAADEHAPRELAVEEVTVFKDGHAFVLEAGTLPVNAEGDVALERLPAPVLGTFWPFADQDGATLESVRAGSETISVSRTALDLWSLVAANVGRPVIVTDIRDKSFHARIAGVPERSEEERRETDAPTDDPVLPVRSQLVLFETDQGLKAMPFKEVRDVVFLGEAERKLDEIEQRNRMVLGLQWDAVPAKSARVGMMYLQRGLRWIPGYKVDLGDGGKAVLKLQATLVNDLRNLDDVGVNLVIGVPTFRFQDQVDPISLQRTLARVAHRAPRRAQMGQMLSNAIMSQVDTYEPESREESAAGPEVAGSDRREDLYVFRVDHVTLAKGHRLVVPVAEMELGYEDVYTLEVPFSPPSEAWPQIASHLVRSPQEAELARLEAAARVMHEVRLTNTGPHPITTAPALVMRDGRVLAQGLLTYTSVGGKVDLPVTTAVDLHVGREDHEVERVHDHIRWRGDTYAQIDMAGKITLTNYKKEKVHVEATRYVLGARPSADHEGEVRLMNALEDSSWTSWRPPRWWAWYSWPHWWYHFNGVARIAWDVTLDPGARVELGYTWSYFWP